jgi:hypothetical protein
LTIDELKNFYVYTGEWKNDKRHGKGTMEWEDDVTFTGTWENGMLKDGLLLFKQSGATYDGFFNTKTGNFEDKGRFEFQDGFISGFFRNGLLTGFGEVRRKNGEFIMSGFFKDGKLDGRGCEITKDGNVYKGECSKGLQHGQGSTVFTDESIHTGLYSQGRPFGKGEL